MEQQILVAAGHRLSFGQDDVTTTWHAVEVRVYAEDPARGFLPTGGRVLALREPDDLVRVDSALTEGSVVGSDYDPMLAKYIAHGSDRDEALRRLRRALGTATVLGVTTNIDFLRRLLADPEVVAGNLDTGLVERRVALLQPERLPGKSLTALVEVTLDRQGAEHLEAFEARAVADASVQQCYRVSPGPDFVLVLWMPDMPAYHALVQRLFTQDANVRNVKAFFSVHRAKFEPRIDVALLAPPVV